MTTTVSRAHKLRDRRGNDPWRVSIAGGLGSFIEFYDFTVYGALALTLDTLFFENQSAVAALFSVLMVYALSFAVSPLGALVFGWFGDRYGRRRALIVTIMGMGLASAAIGLLPTYSEVGITSTALLVLLRVVQGFFAGGEVAGSTTYIAECAPARRRGFFVSINVMGVLGGTAAAAVVAALVRTVIPHQALLDWGWRIPFFVSFPLLVVGLYVRLRLSDSQVFEAAAEEHALSRVPILEVITRHFKSLLRTFGLAFGMTSTGLFSSVFLFIYIVHNAKLPLGWASWTFAGVEWVAVILTPCVGLLADRVGARLPVILGLVGYIVLTPLAMYLMADKNLVIATFMLLLLAVPHALVQAAVPPIYPALFPTRVRYTGMALGFNVAIVVGGGLAPSISSALADSFNSPIAGSGYIVFAGLIGLIALMTLPKNYADRYLPTDPDAVLPATAGAAHGATEAR